LSAEGIGADDAAVALLAREAAGSMRDAMSLLDQVIAWGGNDLKGEEVARVLGVASHRVLLEIAAALVKGDAARCLAVVAELAEQGHDVPHVARDFLRLLRDLVVAKVCPEPGTLLDLPADEAERVLELANGATQDDLVRLHQGFAQGFDDVVRSGQPRAALEMLLVRLARRPPLLPIDELLGRLSALERRLSGAGGRERSEPQRSAPRAEAVLPPDVTPRAEPRSRPAPAPPLAAAPAPAPAAAPAPAPAAPPVRAVRAEPRPLVPAVGPAAIETWRAIVERVAAERVELGAFLMRGALLELAPGGIVLGFLKDEPFVADVERNIALVEDVASSELGVPTTVRVRSDLDRATAAATLAALDSEEAERQRRAALAKVKSHPRVMEALEVLGAKVKDLKLARR
jgi:DNA polymerase III gamma/tau subunit